MYKIGVFIWDLNDKLLSDIEAFVCLETTLAWIEKQLECKHIKLHCQVDVGFCCTRNDLRNLNRNLNSYQSI